MVLNMGPSHPSTHGVLRIILELDGEIITKAIPDMGYLHRGDEKIAENMTYTQFIPYTDRLDYLAPLANNVAYALAVEKFLDDKLPPRGQYIRVICAQLARISSHLLGVGGFAMDVGAMTVFLLTFTEREKIYNLSEPLTGARFTTSYTRIGGVSRDTPPGSCAPRRKFFINEFVTNIDEMRDAAHAQSHLGRSHQGRRRDFEGRASILGLGPESARLRRESRFAEQGSTVSLLQGFEFDVPLGSAGDCYDRYLVRMEEMRQSVKILVHQCRSTKSPAASSESLSTWPMVKSFCRRRTSVMSSMEELIHQFMLVTQGVNFRPAKFTSGRKSEGRTRLLHQQPRRRHAVSDEDSRAVSFVNLSILPELLPGCMVSDVPAVLGSLDFVMGECDR